MARYRVVGCEHCEKMGSWCQLHEPHPKDLENIGDQQRGRIMYGYRRVPELGGDAPTIIAEWRQWERVED